jgi:hypothetical protein
MHADSCESNTQECAQIRIIGVDPREFMVLILVFPL